MFTFQAKNLEYHVPRTFNSSTPPCSFEYQTYDAPIDKYISQPKRFPDAISIQPDPVQNLPFAGFDPKRTFNTYLVKPPPPVLSVHCSVFTDATQIGMTLPHAFNDAKGMSEIMNAWSTCLTHGIDSAAIPELPLDYNPVCHIAANHPPVKLPRHKIFSIWELVQFVARITWDLLWKPRESRKIVHFPVAVLDQMKNEAHTELGETLGHNQSLSNNDILTAWLVKAMFHSDI